METKDILKKLRIDAGLIQQQVAKESGVSYSAYQKYESGERELGANSLKKLADYYGETTDYLLCRKEKQEPYYHEKLEESLKATYLSLPREVRARILQAMVDAVLSYQQDEPTQPAAQDTAISQNSIARPQIAARGGKIPNHTDEEWDAIDASTPDTPESYFDTP